jgi:arylformamidase
VTDTTQPAVRAAPIYRGMDQAALDAAYNNSAAVADSSEWLADWRMRSRASRAIAGVQLDVPYGKKERTRFDYFPCGARDAPLFVFIHGGYWQRNAKEIFSFVSEGPRAHGIDVVAYLGDHTVRFGFDPNKIYIGGWSAGGHLAAIASTWPEVRGSLVISGIFDLEPIALSYINDLLRLGRDEIENYSPLNLLRLGAAPQCLSVGGNELTELKRQTSAYAKASFQLGLPVKLRVLSGHHHFSILDELAKADGELTAELLHIMS